MKELEKGVRILSKPKSKQGVGVIIAEIIIAVAFIYYFLGGYTWTPVVWGIFAIVAVGIISMNLKWYRKEN